MLAKTVFITGHAWEAGRMGGQLSHLLDVARECELELAAGEVPYLDGAIR